MAAHSHRLHATIHPRVSVHPRHATVASRAYSRPRRPTLALRALGIVALTASVALGQEPANAKVEELVVGPAKQGHQYFVSPRGAHLATLMQKGSRFVVVIDGVEGPKFDDVVASTSNNAKLVFSPDGTHCAYVGRSGEEFVVVLDGMEHFKAGSAIDTYGSSPVADLAFTPNSRHLWFRHHVHKSNQTGDNYDCVVFDGVAGLPGGSNPVFGKGGDRFAYVAVNPRDTSQQTVVVDGQPAGYSGTDPLFTGDGEHLIVRKQVPLDQGRQALQALLDGKPWVKAEDAKFYPAPTGPLVAAAIVRSDLNAGTRTSFLVVGGKKVDETTCGDIINVTISPDGKRYAAECRTTQQTYFVVVDGKKNPEYTTVAGVAFSPDSSHVVYTAGHGGKFFVVVDGEESDAYTGVQESAFGGSKRFGYVALADVSERILAVDGQLSSHKASTLSGLAFSADGSRSAAVVGNGSAEHLVLDGVTDDSIRVLLLRSTMHPQPPRFVLSPAGGHVAVCGAPTANTEAAAWGLFLDGRRVRAGQAFFNVDFTPDGKHLLWMELDAPKNRHTLFVDGRSCAELDAGVLIQPNATSWEIGADGVLTVLGQDGDKMKRLRVTPSADASVDTLLAGASTAGAGQPAK